MRKIIFITAMVLASATAHAGETRGLSLASSEPPVAVEQPKALDQKQVEQKAVEPKPIETPKAVPAPVAGEAPAYVARPAPVGSAPEATKAEPKPVAEKATKTTRGDKPKRRRETTEARVIRELHRHGIYW